MPNDKLQFNEECVDARPDPGLAALREGNFTRADGTTGGMGEFRLAVDTSDTKFAEQIDVPEALKTLPNMGGAGNVRELQQAATQSGGLQTLLEQFTAAPTRAEQKALLDPLLTAWANDVWRIAA